MSKSNTHENEYLLLVLNNTNMALVGDATGLRGSTTAGSFYLAGHIADPGEAGDQTTSEASYTGYTRVAMARSSAAFSVSGNVASFAANVSWPQCTGGSSQTLTHWSLGVASSGASKILWSGTITPNLTVSTGVTPQMTTGTTITED